MLQPRLALYKPILQQPSPRRFSHQCLRVLLLLLLAFALVALSSCFVRHHISEITMAAKAAPVLANPQSRIGVSRWLSQPLRSVMGQFRGVPVSLSHSASLRKFSASAVSQAPSYKSEQAYDRGTTVQTPQEFNRSAEALRTGAMSDVLVAPEVAPQPVMTHALGSWEGAELLNLDPQAWLMRGVLSNEQCDTLVSSAASGELEEFAYEQPGAGVLVKWNEIAPRLAALSLLAGANRAFALLQQGEQVLDAIVAGSAVASLFCGVALGLANAGKAAAGAAVGGKVFTGTKWRGASVKKGSAAAAAVERFVGTLENALLCDRSTMEPLIVTRYRVGEQQRVHTDARLPVDAERLAQYLESGGQRLVQAVCYLKSCERGGETKFHHAAMKYLEVPPTKGDVLVFFPAFADGQADERLPHSGAEVLEGEKYILNTWICEEKVPGAPSQIIGEDKLPAVRGPESSSH
eukprot:gnl/MRDRNA2_/MRDRNA2_70718_c0_seq1.p1 gnl/MRDRNA2_/MRDRNA2_70718_c0~~gnl/MRDRNA2_/MRDRNA2_70718_c0_seq1.p1  ORF type:complete len:463 (+),score=83.62 gnl/MRDRNA2_/MRDRNA2_70718_c0_seq1:92-1480(+)